MSAFGRSVSVPWVESTSRSFRARHGSADADDAVRLLASLERTRVRLEEVFPRVPEGLSIVLHDSVTSLTLSNPLLPAARLLTAPAARRYVAGWSGRDELHVLAPRVLLARASKVPGSREMLALTAAALYSRRVILENNHELPRRSSAARLAVEMRWAWLLEGTARWFCGQTQHARPAIARRLREGRSPSFPPGLRDATLLGGTVVDLLVREEGELAAAQFAARLHPHGPRAGLKKAFNGRPLVHTEGAWRAHLARLAGER
jgi:hypothetical protein